MPEATITADYFPSELRQLTATAIEVLDTHVADERGWCVHCGTQAPCEPAQLAERDLAGL